MANVTSVWIHIKDANGNEALEVFQLDLKNATPPLSITEVAFYEKGEEGINRKLEANFPASEFLVAE